MFTRAMYVTGLFAAAGLGTAALIAPTPASPRAVTVHEWGTFTTVAGANGAAIDWLPLGGPSDLPCFVEHFQNRPTIKVVGDYGGPLDYEHARSAILGKVRMETPVLYFYGEEETQLNVKVRFPHGLMTEWFPHADVSEMIMGAATLRQSNQPAVIEWKNVRVSPRSTAALQSGAGESHYYAARATDAAALNVGPQRERFLFYRGVATFDVPVSASALPNGRVKIERDLGVDVPGVVLFERRGATLGYRVLGTLHGDTTVDAPSLDSNLAGLRERLEHTLIDAGLFPKEAAAMLATWRDSWFEDGVRVFYIVPRTQVDAILPLEITPAPAHVARVFVGRMEVVTATTESTVQQAIASNNTATLAKYARFLGPISDRLMAKASTEAEKSRIRSATNAALALYLKQSVVCE